MSGDVSNNRTDGLVEGSVGPFYIAFSHATFYLLTVIYLSIAPLLVYVIRDASTSVRIVVAAGLAMETGALAHVYLERIRDVHKLPSWGAHARRQRRRARADPRRALRPLITADPGSLTLQWTGGFRL